MLDWENSAKMRIIEGAAQEESLPCDVLRHAVAAAGAGRHSVPLERLLGVCRDWIYYRLELITCEIC